MDVFYLESTPTSIQCKALLVFYLLFMERATVEELLLIRLPSLHHIIYHCFIFKLHSSTPNILAQRKIIRPTKSYLLLCFAILDIAFFSASVMNWCWVRLREASSISSSWVLGIRWPLAARVRSQRWSSALFSNWYSRSSTARVPCSESWAMRRRWTVVRRSGLAFSSSVMASRIFFIFVTFSISGWLRRPGTLVIQLDIPSSICFENTFRLNISVCAISLN
mmetsp:Transcript_5210/g.7692  ORF Transcript_5210/g.7692 Transcript_5210/m.7692 type:complete len:222 (-) Transcript_5210:153-818(-)